MSFLKNNLNFTEFNFEPSLQSSIESMGYENATPIQEKAIPIILAGKDLIACAQTGTGKTAAFLLPILHKLSLTPSDFTNTLIVVPTRELALQIDQALQGFTYFSGISTMAIYGGSDGMVFQKEKKAFLEGTNIIIATPGRLIAHLNMGYVKLPHLKHFILDEADRMLDMGFFEDITKIITHIPKDRQSLMFSATMPHKIRTLANQLLKNPEEISLSISKPAAGITQSAYLVFDHQKNKLIKHILSQKEYSSVIIFVSTKIKVKTLEVELQRERFKAKAIHSDLEQSEREEVLRNFKNKSLQILVATDILSRGIDIEDIGLVINYDIPNDAEDYVHRIGRTARAESKGEAITFINDFKQFKFLDIENLIGYEVNKLPLPEKLGVAPTYNPKKIVEKPFTKRYGKR